MQIKDVIDAFRHYLGNDPPLIQVDKKLYSVKNISFNNINGRPIIVAGHEVSITKQKGDTISPSDLVVGDTIEGQHGIYTVVAHYLNEVQLVRPIVVTRANGYYHTEFEQVKYELPNLVKSLIYAGSSIKDR
jgi:hypothetical protein